MVLINFMIFFTQLSQFVAINKSKYFEQSKYNIWTSFIKKT